MWIVDGGTERKHVVMEVTGGVSQTRGKESRLPTCLGGD